MAAPFWQAMGQSGWAIVALLFVPAVLSGASFPVAVRLLLEDPALAGRSVGQAVAINTAGGIAGALLTGFVLLPRFGLDASTRWLTGVSIAGGALCMVVRRARGRARRGIVAVAACVAAWLAIPAVLRTRLPTDYLANGGQLVAFREGLQSNLAVIRRDGTLDLEIDRWWQGRIARVIRSWPRTCRCCFIRMRGTCSSSVWARGRRRRDS
jgi:spermidine synthase